MPQKGPFLSTQQLCNTRVTRHIGLEARHAYEKENQKLFVLLEKIAGLSDVSRAVSSPWPIGGDRRGISKMKPQSENRFSMCGVTHHEKHDESWRRKGKTGRPRSQAMSLAAVIHLT